MEKHRKLNEEVIDCIITSFVDLLKEKSFEKISIIEIIEHAGVSRNSFYRNFSSKEDILVRHIEQITEDFINRAQIPVFKVSWEIYIKTILEHMLNNRGLTDILLNNGKNHLISRIFDKAIYEKASGKLDESHIWFLSGGMFNLYQHWAEDGYKESPEEIAKSFSVPLLNM